MTELEAETLKLVRTQLITAETRLYDHVVTTFRWLMATLFAGNGGAIIALLGSDGTALNDNEAALGWFAGGLLLSVLMGILSGIWGHRASVRITTVRVKIDQSLLEGEMNEQVLTDLSAEKPDWKTWIPSYVGTASYLCLVIGILTIGWRL